MTGNERQRKVMRRQRFMAPAPVYILTIMNGESETDIACTVVVYKHEL